ncbi:extracellular solute-binding protein [Cohnella thailandensis]|uniref:Extracellular solute-binding protein n=1 Tax=Cohnella thailandensis TaxID=557557 RepID=A0A841SS93_9BACL|nr:extracellular solute-binding protein [Cohnella thailandensis]MBB6635233.1 extracellular solute-binding protein [Cohnella thailandensis]MBP1974299.1 putative aldouronate transport system substrate-binding protein [Cohnella thailandensis]
MGKINPNRVGVLTSVVLLTTALAACSSNNNGEESGAGGNESKAPATTSASSASASQETKEPVKIKMFNRVNADVVIDGNPVIEEAGKLANVKLEVEAPPINNYVDKLQVVMASGDLPDLIYNWGTAGNGADANMEKWAQNGLLEPLDDKIANYPNLMNNITKEMWDAVKSVNDGKTYIIPRPNVVNHWGYVINQQWLDKLQLKAPTTLDEFTEVVRAFAKNDPDGNGKDDTYGLSLAGPDLGRNTIWNATNFLTSAFNLPVVDGVKDTDGNYKIREKMSGYLPYLTYLRQLNEEKLIDPEFLINKIYVDQEKLNQFKVGIIYGHQTAVLGNISKLPDSEKIFSYHAVLKNDQGVAYDWITPAMWGGWMIPKDSKKVDDILAFLDWGNTAEANALFQIGIQGLTYDSYDPSTKLITRTEEQANKLKTISSTYLTPANAINGDGASIVNGDTPERLAVYQAQLDEALKQMTAVNVPAVRSPKILNLNSSIPDLVKKKDEKEIAYITGAIDEAKFKEFLEKEWYPATADAEKEYVDFMNSLGK